MEVAPGGGGGGRDSACASTAPDAPALRQHCASTWQSPQPFIHKLFGEMRQHVPAFFANFFSITFITAKNFSIYRSCKKLEHAGTPPPTPPPVGIIAIRVCWRSAGAVLAHLAFAGASDQTSSDV